MDTIDIDTQTETTTATTPINTTMTHATDKNFFVRLFSGGWGRALVAIFPLYIAVHVASFVTTCLAALFLQKDFAWGSDNAVELLAALGCEPFHLYYAAWL